MNRIRLLVISADYPGPDLLYGDTFVHSRVKRYQSSCDVAVIGFNPHVVKDRIFEYEGISVCITRDQSVFEQKVIEYNPDVIAAHLIQHTIANVVLSFQKPFVIFVHGFEALSWKRRLMNYTKIGDLPYLWKYIHENRKQLKGLAKFAEKARGRSDVHFVFVSNWLKKAAQHDLRIRFENSHVIPNGIDTSLFAFHHKPQDHRKKILVLRSFKARNYANDLTIDAIKLLSQKNFFKDLEFCIYGEGYLFQSLTDQVKHFSNVTLRNSFVENKSIPAIHQNFGIFLCPSRLDTQGVSMCEAMASGLVPITSPTGGIPEYATDGVSSFQVKTAKDIADKIEFLYHNPDVFLNMSVQARQEIITKCDLTSTISKELKVIKSVLKETPVTDVYQQCVNCVLDVHDDPEMTFNEEGVCSYCTNYAKQELAFVKKGEEGEQALVDVVKEIKAAGQGKPYDCILGLSGGVDSTYLAYQAKKFGLRPLAVHFDNGWNSELAVHNIENIVNRLGFDLHTFVIDWEEFKDLQLSFLKASVVDIELLTDHAIITKLYQLAIKHNIKYILSGTNVVTEAVLPSPWIHNKRDHIHIRAIQEKFGSVPINTFPLFTSSLKWWVVWKGIKSVSLLDLMPYNKKDVKKTIAMELGWRDYGGKHYESVFTRFYQGYILPAKFKIDKRKAHLSNLICSGQLTRDEALQELNLPAYDEATRKSDHEFVLKKLGLSQEEFEIIMKAPVRKHAEFPVEDSIYSRFPLLKIVRPFWQKIKGIRKLS